MICIVPTRSVNLPENCPYTYRNNVIEFSPGFGQFDARFSLVMRYVPGRFTTCPGFDLLHFLPGKSPG